MNPVRRFVLSPLGILGTNSYIHSSLFRHCQRQFCSSFNFSTNCNRLATLSAGHVTGSRCLDDNHGTSLHHQRNTNHFTKDYSPSFYESFGALSRNTYPFDVIGGLSSSFPLSSSSLRTQLLWSVNNSRQYSSSSNVSPSNKRKTLASPSQGSKRNIQGRVRRPSSSDGKLPAENKETKDEGVAENLTLYQRFKKTYKEHGKILIAVHLLTSSVWFGSFYAAARLGIDIVPYLESWNLSEKIISPFRSGGLGDIALAYLMYKLATPARYTVTIGGTNLAIRYLRKGGRMKPIAKEDTLRSMYKEGKEDLKLRRDTRIGGLKTRFNRSRLGRIRQQRQKGHKR